jgi:hypothetical protein
VVGNDTELVIIVPIGDTEEAVAQPHGTPHDRLEYRLDLGGRAADHLQDLPRRRLLIERLSHLSVGVCERTILLLQLGEQPHVLDRDHRLVGEGL